MTPTLRSHPAFSIPPYTAYTPPPPTHPSPSGHLSRSQSSELAVETRGIYHTAELDGIPIGRANPRDSTRSIASSNTGRARKSEGQGQRINTEYVAYSPHEKQGPVARDLGEFV